MRQLPCDLAVETARIYDRRYADGPPNAWACSDAQEADSLVQLVDRCRARLSGPTPTGATCLDIGCALGCITAAFARAGYRVTGIDYSRIAVEKASRANSRVPGCDFLCMDAFRPRFDGRFDLIFCRGFSGYNTHQVDAVTRLINTYMPLLEERGVFVLAYSSTFSGKETGQEMANWTRGELRAIRNGVHAERTLGPVYYFHRSHHRYRWLLTPLKTLLGRRHNFCIFFRRQSEESRKCA